MSPHQHPPARSKPSDLSYQVPLIATTHASMHAMALLLLLISLIFVALI